MISLRDPNALVIINIETEEVLWYGEGIWKKQHDPDILADGRVLLFDNRGLPDSPNGHSRVLEIDIFTHEVYWQ